jgi:hypothetical protein
MSNAPDTRDPADRLDALLRSELRWETPPALTAQLLGLVPGGAAISQYLIIPERPKRWYVWLVSILTVVAVVVSLLVAAQLYSTLGDQIGLPGLWQALADSVSNSWARLVDALPAARYLLLALAGVRNYLYWLLLVAVLWVALDGWSPRFPTLRRQVS